MNRNLFLAISVPNDIAPDEDDPDEVADQIVRLLNQQRATTAVATAIIKRRPVDGVLTRFEPVMVNAIPSPQWLTPETLATLRAAARGEP